MSITLTAAHRLDNDVLEVHGTDDAGAEVIAHGWQSATTNHYDASAYSVDADGTLQRDPAAQPREMTGDDLRAYCQALLDATVPPAPLPADHPDVITFA